MIHTYVVTLMRNDTAMTHDVEERAFTAADAIAQVELRERGSYPGSRVYRVTPHLHGRDECMCCICLPRGRDGLPRERR
jgi:hypothetical protein